MKMMARKAQIGVIVGSLCRGSFSRRVAKALMDRAPNGWSCSLVEIGELPLYNQDLDPEPPKPWEDFRDAVKACDALLFVTPEYNRSIPGVLKNAMDIGSRPQGCNVFAGKPAAVVSVSPYSGGAMAANHALRQSFVYLDLAVMQQPEAYIRDADKVVDADGTVSDSEADKRLSQFMQAFAAWVERVGTAPATPFDAFLRHREGASNAYINGDAGPVVALSTKSDPATFFPPSGDRVIGAEAVNAANEKGAQAFTQGSTGRFEILASEAGSDFAYWTGIQHAQARMSGKDGPVPMRLRTTEIFRNEGGEWKLVHRHADFIKQDQ
jgi:NAD(P)H-dependent FMN reductase/ketosteroid isomerase-like protein